MDWVKFLSENYVQIVLAFGALLTFAQLVVRMTPTQSDDMLLGKLDKVYKAVFDFLKIPNVKP
jgi:hypothetical protein